MSNQQSMSSPQHSSHQQQQERLYNDDPREQYAQQHYQERAPGEGSYEEGYQESELIGHRLVDWVESSQQADFEAALETTANGHQVENLELRAKRSDASMGHFSISLSPMRDEQSAVNSVVVVMTDITDAVLLQAKLAHSEKMATIGRLVSGVAHEVNNPLAAILGFTDLLLENPEVPPSAQEDLKIILQETQRTKDIVQDLLSFARRWDAAPQAWAFVPLAEAERLPRELGIRMQVMARGPQYAIVKKP